MVARARRRPYRRRVLLAGIGAGVVAATAGAPWYVSRVERDVEHRVTAAMGAAGLAGVEVSASGQDVRLACDDALDDPQTAVDVAAGVRGVRGISVGRSCRVDDPIEPVAPSDPADTAGATTATIDGAPATSVASAGPSGFASVGDLVAASPRFSVLAGLVEEAGLADELRDPGPFTILAPTDDAFDDVSAEALAAVRDDPDLAAELLRRHVVSGVAVIAAELGPDVLGGVDVDGVAVVEADLAAGNGVVQAIDAVLVPEYGRLSELAPLRPGELRAVLDDGRLSLAGTVATAAQRDVLVAAATSRLARENVDDRLTVDPSSGVDDLVVRAYAALVGAMPGHVGAGTARSDGNGHTLVGTYTTDDARLTVENVAAVVDGDVALEERPTAAAGDVTSMSARLAGLLGASPIEFEPGTSTVSASSAAVLDRVAGMVSGLGGTLIVVEGHTDSVGAAPANLALGTARVDAVVDALVARGVPAEDLVAVGIGEAEPVLVDGVEDPVASHRVLVSVEVAA